MRSLRPALIPALLVVIASVGCGPAVAPTSSDHGDPTIAPLELTIYAAASLTGVLDEVKAAYEPAHPGLTLTTSTDSSSALETKLEQGAPADVFLSADTTNPQKLIDAGFAAGSMVVFAGNKLIVIVPKDNPAGIESAADLAEDGVDIIAAGEEVPITKYANELVANLGQQPGYLAGFAAAYTANVVSKEENVRAVVAKIELGQGDAGIVYVTDAAASSKITPIEVPAAANVPTTYGGVVVKASTHQAAAQSFVTWLAAGDGQAILGTFGFLPPPR